MITLVLGGARSGKSEVAEKLAAAGPGPVIYIATYDLGLAADADMAARIEAHRARRPGSWTTVEASGAELPVALARVATETVLLDALGTWLAGSPDFVVDADGLCTALAGRNGDTIVVSDEVGLGVHPATEAGRRFRDALGVLNQRVAAVADDVLLVVAGRVLHLDRA